ncbi:cystathionine beta-lyase [Hyphomonas beringensis]|uniref:cystathionine beta-lyase n=1 Tax=Hyphomonas beringensis TaxID=1280946 RepID=UPI000558B45F|nr:cystathionine beta-lyase [Hyphomonas beringensis]
MSKHLETRIIHTRKDRLPSKTVNPPVERASTLLFDTADRLYGAQPGYGRMGLTVHRELEAALCELENAQQVRLTSNGLQACALAIASQVKAGDHILYSDSTYGPTSRFCDRRLARMGIESTRFDPRIGAGIEDLIRPNTTLIYLEAPGSLTFEISDTPAIVEVAKKHDIRTAMDNTWGAGLYHKPLDLGVDISVQALTKYVAGHSDAFAGAVMTRDKRIAQEVVDTSEDWGISLSADDAYTALRGLRSLATRLKAHEAAGLEVANWLTHRPEVAQVVHPALPTHPDHAIWKRDFTGSCGLFSFILEDAPPEAVDKFIAALSLFSMGFSWGGFESLIIPCDQQLTRMEDSWTQTRAGPLMRIHIGLEAVPDLIADLEAGFAAMADA